MVLTLQVKLHCAVFKLVEGRVVTLVNVGELCLQSVEFVLVLRLSVLQLLKFGVQL